MIRLAIIPARGGSKRIPDKNIKLFLGKPIISYVIETALTSQLFDEVMVSTDSEQIAEVAKAYGATVPFLRSSENSGDFASTADVLAEVLNYYELKNTKVDTACCIYPTAPLITSEHLKEAANKLNQHNYETVFSILKFSYPIQRALAMEKEKVKMIWPENLEKRSQDLLPAFHDAGQFYFFRPQEFIRSKSLFTKNSGYVLLSEYQAQDIDNEDDWIMAELKYKYLKHKLPG